MIRAVSRTSPKTTTRAIPIRRVRIRQGYASSVDSEANYSSGEDYVVMFLGYRFSFNASDFEQRVTAAAVKLGLLAGNELDDDETADLVELVERDAIEEPRGAWLDHRVKEGKLDIDWDDEAAEFSYHDPLGGRPLAELLPTPSWRDVQY